MTTAPLPWKLHSYFLHGEGFTDILTLDGERVACVSGSNREWIEANAALIVRAVNAHDAMREAIKLAMRYVEDRCDEGPYRDDRPWQTLAKMQSALALASGTREETK